MGNQWILDHAGQTVDLYAVWTAKKVTVVFHKNDGSSTGTVTETYTYGVSGQKFGYGNGHSYAATATKFGSWAYTGHSFLGWNTDKTATSKTYDGNYAVTDNWINTNAGKTIDVHAIWRLNKCTITFDPNSGTFGTNNTNRVQTMYYGGKVDNFWNANGGTYSATRTGYYIKPAEAWIKGSTKYDETKAYTTAQVCTNIANGDESVTLKVNWVAKVLTVKFHQNLNLSDTSDPATQSFTYGVSGNKFGYNTDGTAKWGTSGKFGSWTNGSYDLDGWSKTRTATSASWETYSGVANSWILEQLDGANTGTINLWAIWTKTDRNSLCGCETHNTATDYYWTNSSESEYKACVSNDSTYQSCLSSYNQCVSNYNNCLKHQTEAFCNNSYNCSNTCQTSCNNTYQYVNTSSHDLCKSRVTGTCNIGNYCYDTSTCNPGYYKKIYVTVTLSSCKTYYSCKHTPEKCISNCH